MTTMTAVRSQKSTIVRFGNAAGPIRTVFRVLERVAPALGARWAEQIWFTLPTPRNTPRNTPRDTPRGRPGSTEPPGRPFQINGHQVVGEMWGEGPTVYLLHGWAGHRGQFGSFVEPLVARGLRVVAFDAPSHGGSAPGAYGPQSSSIPEFAEALSTVVSRYGPARAVVAHSLGAAAAAVAVCDGLRADRLVLLAPMASPAAFAQRFAEQLGFGERTYRRLEARITRRVGAPMHHFDVPALGQAIAMPKTLIVHDREDTYTPVTDGMAVAEAWTGSRLHLTSGLGHARLLRDPEVIAEVADFITH